MTQFRLSGWCRGNLKETIQHLHSRRRAVWAVHLQTGCPQHKKFKAEFLLCGFFYSLILSSDPTERCPESASSARKVCLVENGLGRCGLPYGQNLLYRIYGAALLSTPLPTALPWANLQVRPQQDACNVPGFRNMQGKRGLMCNLHAYVSRVGDAAVPRLYVRGLAGLQIQRT